MHEIPKHPKGSVDGSGAAPDNHSTEYHSPISLEFAQRLAQLEEHHAVQAVILFEDPTQNRSAKLGPSAHEAQENNERRLSKEERLAKFALRKELTEPFVEAIADVLEEVGGHCLSKSVTALGTITVETTVQGVWELSTVAGVQAIIENQTLHGLQHQWNGSHRHVSRRDRTAKQGPLGKKGMALAAGQNGSQAQNKHTLTQMATKPVEKRGTSVNTTNRHQIINGQPEPFQNGRQPTKLEKTSVMSDTAKSDNRTSSGDVEAPDIIEPKDFIREAIEADTDSGRFDGRVHTRFPPEPNGYLHIGHAKALCINFGLAEEYGGKCNLRFDDTNPTKEKTDYVDAILEDIRWLGFDWEDRLYYASDYFEQLYQFALEMIDTGQAFVCELSAEEMREYRGTLTAPGRNSPYRDRPVEENRDLFERMRAGEFAEGQYTLRAKFDMASPNINLRDPVMYRIIDEPHWRTGTEWPIYPMYDWAHGQSDSIEGITHSLCTLEYLNHRPLYDHYLERLEIYHPQQLEFARLGMNYTVTSKRKLLKLVEEGTVSGWDDPRMPTLAGMRRRGYTPEAIRNFCDDIGLARTNSTVEMALLEYHIRQDLNARSNRVMAVLNPLKVVIENYPEGEGELFEAVNNPEDESAGTRMVPFSREIYIERDDFMEDPPRKFFRLAPGREVRLRYACLITCTDVIKDENGEVVELRATWDPDSKGGNAPDGRRVKGTLHWVSAAHAVPIEVRVYDRLFASPTPEKVDEGEDFTVNLNPDSLQVNTNALAEPALANAEVGARYQFERLGYFAVDPDTTAENLVFNRTVPLRDSWAKIEKQRKQSKKK